MIEGVTVKSLRVIPDERGWLMEIIRRDDPFFTRFGQTYLTVVYPGVVKGWHWHREQTDHFCVLKGMAKVVLFDRRDGSPTRGEINEFFLGEKNPQYDSLPDISARELVTLVPIGLVVLLLGIYPMPVLNLMKVTLNNLITVVAN